MSVTFNKWVTCISYSEITDLIKYVGNNFDGISYAVDETDSNVIKIIFGSEPENSLTWSADGNVNGYSDKGAYVTVAGTKIKPISTTSTKYVSGYRYYLKENGEFIVSGGTSSSTGTFCTFVVCKSEEGKWCGVMQMPPLNYYTYYDMYMPTGEGCSFTSGLSISNNNTPDTNTMVMLKNIPVYDNVMISNAYINVHGQLPEWQVIELNGERYAVGHKSLTLTSLALKL